MGSGCKGAWAGRGDSSHGAAQGQGLLQWHFFVILCRAVGGGGRGTSERGRTTPPLLMLEGFSAGL